MPASFSLLVVGPLYIMCTIKLSLRTALAVSRKIVFLALFAFFASRVIIAVMKLESKELYGHSFSHSKK